MDGQTLAIVAAAVLPGAVLLSFVPELLRYTVEPAQKALFKTLSADNLGIRELAGEPITAVLTKAPGNGQSIGGVKVTTANGWFAARPSGTEDVYKIYAESFVSADHLTRIQQEAQAALGALFAKAA